MKKVDLGDRHHFLPQFYLGEWLGGDHKLEEYGRLPHNGQIKSRRRGTYPAGFRYNLYTLPGVTEDAKQNVEKVFYQEVDTSAAKVMQKLLAGGTLTLTDTERFQWSRFLLSLGIRNPEEMQKFKDRVAIDFLKPDSKTEEIYARIRKEGQPLTAEEALLQANPSMPELSAIITTTRLVQNRKVLATIMDMDWMVFDVSRVKRKLLTSDRPLVMTGGLMRPDGHIALPISPTKMFIAATLPTFNNELALSPVSRFVRKANEVQIAQARENVYAVDNSDLAEIRRGMSKGEYFSLASVPKKIELSSPPQNRGVKNAAAHFARSRVGLCGRG